MEQTGDSVAAFCDLVVDRTVVRARVHTLKKGKWGRKGGRLLRGRLKELSARSQKSSAGELRHKVPVPLQLKVAMHKLSDTDSSIATRFQIHPRTVPRIVEVVAHCQLECQAKLMEQLTRWLGDSKPKLRFAAASTMFDETGQKLKVCVPGGGLGTDVSSIVPLDAATAGSSGNRKLLQKHATIDIMASRMFFQWQEEVGRLRAFEITVPPLPVPRTNARSLWGVLRQHPILQTTLRFKRALLDAAAEGGGLALDFDQTDAASGNDLYFAATCMTDNPLWVKEQVLCMSHQNHHSLMTIVHAVSGVPLVGSLYTMASFLRMGTYMLRCVLALRGFLALPGRVMVENASMVSAARVGQEKQYSQELTDYVLANSSKTDVGMRNHAARLAKLFDVWS